VCYSFQELDKSNKPPYFAGEKLLGEYRIYSDEFFLKEFIAMDPEDDFIREEWVLDNTSTAIDLLLQDGQFGGLYEDVYGETTEVKFQATPEYEGLYIRMTISLTDFNTEMEYVIIIYIDKRPEEVEVEEVVNNSTYVPAFTEEEKKSIAAVPVVNQTQLNLEKFERILDVYEHLFFSGQPLSSPSFVSLIRDKIPFPVPYLA